VFIKAKPTDVLPGRIVYQNIFLHPVGMHPLIAAKGASLWDAENLGEYVFYRALHPFGMQEKRKTPKTSR